MIPLKNGFYLSDIIDTSKITTGKLNVINAPCGCGKTTCAINILAPMASNSRKALYLIDTRNAFERLIQEDTMAAPYFFYGDDIISHAKPVSIAEEDPETIKDYNSPLATVLDDVAAFIENCQSLFPRESLEHELDVLRSLGSFLPSFASLYNSITTSLNEKEITSWYDNFLVLSDAYLALPEWMYTSI